MKNTNRKVNKTRKAAALFAALMAMTISCKRPCNSAGCVQGRFQGRCGFH